MNFQPMGNCFVSSLIISHYNYIQNKAALRKTMNTCPRFFSITGTFQISHFTLRAMCDVRVMLQMLLELHVPLWACPEYECAHGPDLPMWTPGWIEEQGCWSIIYCVEMLLFHLPVAEVQMPFCAFSGSSFDLPSCPLPLGLEVFRLKFKMLKCFVFF